MILLLKKSLKGNLGKEWHPPPPYFAFHTFLCVFPGDAQACMSVAHCYNHGKGVSSQDFDKAYIYHKKAADLGMTYNITNFNLLHAYIKFCWRWSTANCRCCCFDKGSNSLVCFVFVDTEHLTSGHMFAPMFFGRTVISRPAILAKTCCDKGIFRLKNVIKSFTREPKLSLRPFSMLFSVYPTLR